MNFNNTELNNKEFDDIYIKLNDDFNGIVDSLDLDNETHKNIIQDIYYFSSLLKQNNEKKIKELNETMQIIDEVNNKTQTKIDTLNIDDLNDDFSKTKEQNSQNMKSFLEKYLYIIIKIIFIIMLLIIMAQFNSISFFNLSLFSTNLFSKLNFFKNKTDNTMKKSDDDILSKIKKENKIIDNTKTKNMNFMNRLSINNNNNNNNNQTKKNNSQVKTN